MPTPRQLTDAEKADMLQMYADGAGVKAIMKKHGTSLHIFTRVRTEAGVPARTSAETLNLWRKANGISAPRKAAKKRQRTDVPCGWDGTPVVVTIAPGETWCRTCFETTTGNYCARCGTGNAETVQAADVLRQDEYRVMT